MSVSTFLYEICKIFSILVLNTKPIVSGLFPVHMSIFQTFCISILIALKLQDTRFLVNFLKIFFDNMFTSNYPT